MAVSRIISLNLDLAAALSAEQIGALVKDASHQIQHDTWHTWTYPLDIGTNVGIQRRVVRIDRLPQDDNWHGFIFYVLQLGGRIPTTPELEEDRPSSSGSPRARIRHSHGHDGSGTSSRIERS